MRTGGHMDAGVIDPFAGEVYFDLAFADRDRLVSVVTGWSDLFAETVRRVHVAAAATRGIREGLHRESEERQES